MNLACFNLIFEVISLSFLFYILFIRRKCENVIGVPFVVIKIYHYHYLSFFFVNIVINNVLLLVLLLLLVSYIILVYLNK